MSITLSYFLKAFIIGIAVAAPVGPISMLCIRKSIEHGIAGAISVGLGAALADGVYSLIAILGLTAVSDFLIDEVHWIKIIGGLFLLYLAYRELTSKPRQVHVSTLENKSNFIGLTVQIFFLTLTNPMTILSFIAIFASIGGENISLIDSFAMVIGIFLGSLVWMLFLGTVIVKIKHKLSESWLNNIRYFSALILSGFGVFAIATALF